MANDRPEIRVDEDVRAVAAFMTANVPAARLVAVAKAMGEMAPLLWGQYAPEQVQALQMRYPAPISDHDLSTQSSAIESSPQYLRADGDSVGGTA